ncbi:hypothetical protein Cpir12675_006236 [Ceratocystis pirilliformis]|uniref:Mannan endo-1,6-alpha-mannosidase n=1 Tax=Ceratocystis pirilliformis TaxID=259994 RepID=A0ABR3YJB6_9PEZI
MAEFYKSAKKAATAATVLVAALPPNSLIVDNSENIKGVARTLAQGVMSYYQPDNPAILIGDLPDPYYWWEAGAMWGSMIDYYHYTNDSTYNDLAIEALLAPVNTGTNFDFMPIEHASEEGNDDLGFWGFAVMSAAERNFPQPNPDVPSWLQLSINIFNSLESRWNTTACGGGLLWQIYESSPHGLNYKNTVSNGGFFQLAARLARVTGDKKYLDWAVKVWDWTENIGMIGTDYIVYDGAHAAADCRDTNPVSFSYSNAIYMYGAAVLANVTGEKIWADRAQGILTATSKRFFYPEANAANVMYESACETVGTCNEDMKSFKAYLSRFMWKSTEMLPDIKPQVNKLLETSALAAVKTCTAGESGSECGMRWYTGSHDGISGLGQQMSALEIVQGLLVDGITGPLKSEEVQVIRKKPWADEEPAVSSSSSSAAASTLTSAPATPPASILPTLTNTAAADATNLAIAPPIVAVKRDTDSSASVHGPTMRAAYIFAAVLAAAFF